jgi:hypothetical protein
LNDNVFVSYKRKNMDRFQKRREKACDKSYDPLTIDDFDWGNEWVNPTMPPPEGARGCPDDIPWERKRPAPTPSYVQDLDESDDKEDDQECSSIPNGEDDGSGTEDDVDVTDDDEDPTSADKDGENRNATMDEFDDGF